MPPIKQPEVPNRDQSIVAAHAAIHSLDDEMRANGEHHFLKDEETHHCQDHCNNG